jgi:hypothetical protein
MRACSQAPPGKTVFLVDVDLTLSTRPRADNGHATARFQLGFLLPTHRPGSIDRTHWPHFLILPEPQRFSQASSSSSAAKSESDGKDARDRGDFKPNGADAPMAWRSATPEYANGTTASAVHLA